MARLGFDGLASSYELLERLAFGNALERARWAFLPELAQAQRLLVLGEGDGRFLAKLLEVNPHCQVDVVDLSPGMLERAKRRLTAEQLERVQFRIADARTLELPQAHYDALVTLFFLDVFEAETLSSLLPQWAASLQVGGIWYLADFRLPSSGLGRSYARALLAFLYAFFRWLTRIEAKSLVNPKSLLEAAGLSLKRETVQRGGFLHSQLYCKNYPS